MGSQLRAAEAETLALSCLRLVETRTENIPDQPEINAATEVEIVPQEQSADIHQSDTTSAPTKVNSIHGNETRGMTSALTQFFCVACTVIFWTKCLGDTVNLITAKWALVVVDKSWALEFFFRLCKFDYSAITSLIIVLVMELLRPATYMRGEDAVVTTSSWKSRILWFLLFVLKFCVFYFTIFHGTVYMFDYDNLTMANSALAMVDKSWAWAMVNLSWALEFLVKLRDLGYPTIFVLIVLAVLALYLFVRYIKGNNAVLTISQSMSRTFWFLLCALFFGVVYFAIFLGTVYMFDCNKLSTFRLQTSNRTYYLFWGEKCPIDGTTKTDGFPDYFYTQGSETNVYYTCSRDVFLHKSSENGVSPEGLTIIGHRSCSLSGGGKKITNIKVQKTSNPVKHLITNITPTWTVYNFDVEPFKLWNLWKKLVLHIYQNWDSIVITALESEEE